MTPCWIRLALNQRSPLRGGPIEPYHLPNTNVQWSLESRLLDDFFEMEM